MARTERPFLTWTPRVLAIAYAAFLSIFAFDVFGGGEPALQVLFALLVHLIPTFVVLGVVALAWRWRLFGAVAFVGLAVTYIALTWGRFPVSVYVIMSGPLLVIGGLYGLSWWYQGERPPTP